MNVRNYNIDDPMSSLVSYLRNAKIHRTMMPVHKFAVTMSCVGVYFGLRNPSYMIYFNLLSLTITIAGLMWNYSKLKEYEDVAQMIEEEYADEIDIEYAKWIAERH
jgi:hypothetical protein